MVKPKAIGLLRVFVICEVSRVVASGQSISLKCVDTFGCTLDHARSRSTLRVFCANLNLTVVPQCVEDVELLDLNFNFLRRLWDTDFPGDNFGRLEVLLLRNVSLKLIEEDAFASLNNLRQLDLSANLLKFFYSRTFTGNVLLERLNLSSNLIKKLPSSQLRLPKLRTLDLSNGFLEYVDETVFSNLPALEWLSLRENKLKTVPSFEMNVSMLLLGGNPWSCDCAFYVLAARRRVDPLADDLACIDFDRNRRQWNETSLSDMDCEQQQQVDGKPTSSKKFSVASKLEKNVNGKTDNNNTPRLILDIYGYVLLGIGILVFLCCCCDNRKASDQIGCELSNSTDDSHCARIPSDVHCPHSVISNSTDNYYVDVEARLPDTRDHAPIVDTASFAEKSRPTEVLTYVDVLVHRIAE